MCLIWTVESKYRQKRIIITNKITHCAYRDESMLLRDHSNMEYSILKLGGELVIPTKQARPRNADEDAFNKITMLPPVDNLPAQAFLAGWNRRKIGAVETPAIIIHANVLKGKDEISRVRDRAR